MFCKVALITYVPMFVYVYALFVLWNAFDLRLYNDVRMYYGPCYPLHPWCVFNKHFDGLLA